MAIILAAFLAFGITGPKLYKMVQIKGWVPGAERRIETITQKWNQTPELHPRGRNTFWISWGEQDVKTIGNHRTNVEKQKWDQIEIGDPIEVLYVPGDKWAYLKEDIFVDPGNFLFDIILLLGELTFIIQMLKKIRASFAGAKQKGYNGGEG